MKEYRFLDIGERFVFTKESPEIWEKTSVHFATCEQNGSRMIGNLEHMITFPAPEKQPADPLVLKFIPSKDATTTLVQVEWDGYKDCQSVTPFFMSLEDWNSQYITAGLTLEELSQLKQNIETVISAYKAAQSIAQSKG